MDNFSISFIRDPPFPVIDTFLPFTSENEDKVVNPGILAAGEEKSPHLLSHRGFKAFQLISESPMIISGGDIPILDILISRIVMNLVLAVLSFEHSSFTSSVSFGNPIS
ncbi:hypothetical protein Tco_1528120 [Tanacetum coccineum]